jgi:hypothetical protein
MKKLFVSLLFLSLTTWAFSQPAFTEKTVAEINKRFIENPTNDDTAPDYVLTGSEGQKIGMEQLNKMFPNVKHLTWETTDMTIKQYGKVAIVNGITKHSFVSLNDNATHFYHVRGTYVYEYQNDKWRKVSAHHTNVVPMQTPTEEAAIKAVIEKETQSWLNRDADARIACLANVPYALMLVYHGNMASNKGVAYAINEKVNVPEAIKAQTAGMGKPDGSSFKNENYMITIKGGTAFVTYDEISTNAEGKKQHFHEVRNLEKIDGFWKITYIGAVAYTP